MSLEGGLVAIELTNRLPVILLHVTVVVVGRSADHAKCSKLWRCWSTRWHSLALEVARKLLLVSRSAGQFVSWSDAETVNWSAGQQFVWSLVDTGTHNKLDLFDASRLIVTATIANWTLYLQLVCIAGLYENMSRWTHALTRRTYDIHIL